MAAQKKELIYRGVLNTVDGATATVDIPVPTNADAVMYAHTLMHETATGNEDGGLYRRELIAKNDGGTVTIEGTIVSGYTGSASINTGTVTAAASTTNIRFTMTGVAGFTIDWQYRILVIIN